jgi:hypothetical protein
VASWTIPSSSQAPLPCSSLCAGSPNSSTAGIPSAAASPASSTAPSIDRWSIPGIAAIGVRRSLPATTNIGYTRWETDKSVSRTSPRSRPVLRRRRSLVAGNDMAVPESRGQPNLRRLTRASSENARVSASRCTTGSSSSPPLIAPSSARSAGLNGNAPEIVLITS